MEIALDTWENNGDGLGLSRAVIDYIHMPPQILVKASSLRVLERQTRIEVEGGETWTIGGDELPATEHAETTRNNGPSANDQTIHNDPAGTEAQGNPQARQTKADEGKQQKYSYRTVSHHEQDKQQIS